MDSFLSMNHLFEVQWISAGAKWVFKAKKPLPSVDTFGFKTLDL
jgi:hypothetical protein